MSCSVYRKWILCFVSVSRSSSNLKIIHRLIRFRKRPNDRINLICAQMQSLRFVVRPASTPGLRAFSTATAATPAPTAPATSKHRSVVLSQYRWLLSTASQLARRPIARRHLIQFSPPNRMTLPMLEAADVYPSGRHYWSAAFFTKLKAISDRTVPTSPVRPFYGLEELNRLHNSRRAQDEPTDCSLQLTPARARYVLRSVRTDSPNSCETPSGRGFN